MWFLISTGTIQGLLWIPLAAYRSRAYLKVPFKLREQHRQPTQELTCSRRSALSLIPSWSSSVPSTRKAFSTPSAWPCCWVYPSLSSLLSFSSVATAASADGGKKAQGKVAPAAMGSCMLRGTRRKRRRSRMKRTCGSQLSPSCSCWTRDPPCPSSRQEGVQVLSPEMTPFFSPVHQEGWGDTKAAATLW